jgi:hypothetical protein
MKNRAYQTPGHHRAAQMTAAIIDYGSFLCGLLCAMKTNMRFTSFERPAVCLGTLLIAVLFSGCATPALWKSTASGQWVPGEPERVCVFATKAAPTPDMGVFFTQTETTHQPNAKRPVLWCLSQSPTNLTATPMAIATVTNLWRGMRTVPLYSSEAALPASQTTAPPGFAVLLPDGKGFTLHLDGYPAGPYQLPASKTETQVAARIIGMPFAVGVDAALIAAAMCGAAFLDFATTGSGCN